MFYVCLVIVLIPVLWSVFNLALHLANLYGSRLDVYRKGYLQGFADGMKHADFIRIDRRNKG